MSISNPQPAAGNVEAGHGEYPVIGIVSPPCQHGFGTRVYVVQTSGIRRASSSPEVIEITKSDFRVMRLISPPRSHQSSILVEFLDHQRQVYLSTAWHRIKR